MMLTTPIAVVALGPLFALAQTSDQMNLTITLYPSDAESTCEEGGSGGIALTTRTIPRHQTCIDVESIFGGDERVGFLNDTVSGAKHTEEDEVTGTMDPPGIDWYISSENGPETFDSSKNWTNIWFRQLNGTNDGGGEGEVGRWVITTFPNKECERKESEEFPWYKTSCQTPEDGSCEQSPYSIKGIMIRRLWEQDFDSCQTWAELDAAPGLVPRAGVAFLAAFAAFLLM